MWQKDIRTSLHEAIRQQLEDATKQVDEKLLAAANQMQQQVDAEKKKLGDNPSDEDQRRLQLMVAQGRQNVQNNKAAARVRLQQYRNELIIQFRTEVFNFINRANFGVPNLTAFAGSADNEPALSTFGRIRTTVTSSRQIQFGVRLSF